MTHSNHYHEQNKSDNTMKTNPLQNKINTLYWKENKTVRQIAEMFNLPYHKMLNLFDIYKIKKRSRGNPAGIPHRNLKYILINNGE